MGFSYFNEKRIEEDRGFQWQYKDIFSEVHEVLNDKEVLELGTELIKVARDRLTGDLNREEIKKEYLELNDIVNQLNAIIKYYV